MIWESQFWKEDLNRLARQLMKRINQRRWSERSLAKLEKEVFIGFYEIRKLLEAKKLSERLAKSHVTVQEFRFTGSRKVTLLNWNRKVFDAYDFEKPLTKRVSVSFICNQFIHSYIYKEVFDNNGGLNGFFICSDWLRSKNLYHVSVAETIKLFSRVGMDHPKNLSAAFDAETGDYIIRNW